MQDAIAKAPEYASSATRLYQPRRAPTTTPLGLQTGLAPPAPDCRRQIHLRASTTVSELGGNNTTEANLEAATIRFFGYR